MVEADPSKDVVMQDNTEETKNPVELAEQKKNEGNSALKAGNIDQAIGLYTEAIELNKNEGMFTNRAVAYIKKSMYKEALFDCEQALYLNPQFAKAHVRAYTCNLAQGFLPKAMESAQKAVTLGEASMGDKAPFIKELLKYEGFVKAAMKRKEYREAFFYSGRLLDNCQDSIRHLKMKIKAGICYTPTDMTDLIKLTHDYQNKFISNAVFLYWRGRVLLYNGQTDMGKKHIKQALQIDPDNTKAMRFWKSLSSAENLKNSANGAFKDNMFEVAAGLFSQALEIDPLNGTYNQAVLFNRACAYHKLKKYEEALADCDRAIALNKEYSKAYLKRGDIKMDQELWEEALHEYSKLKQVAPQTPGLREKLRQAQLEIKKAKRKNYYAILEVDKGEGDAGIKKAYRKGAIKWHPDKHAASTEEEQKEAEAKFKDIGEAYAVLSDAKKRQMYDEGADIEEINQGGGGGGHGGMNPNDIFQMFFQGGGGGMPGGGRRGGGGAQFNFGGGF